MKTKTSFILVIIFIMAAGAVFAESPREQLKQMVEQLQKSPSDNVLREQIIKLAQTIKPAAAVPEERVNWNDIKDFIQKLNVKTGKQYRLPSEAEWEYACRAGGQQEYCGSNNLDAVAWYEGNSDSTHPVAGKQPNAFGLYDMSGNVWEWVEDCSDSDCSFRVLRGGSWFDLARGTRAVNRSRLNPDFRDVIYGFRLVVSSVRQ